MNGPVTVQNKWLSWLDMFLRKRLKLESGANVIPLGHVVIYYWLFLSLAIPGVVTSPWSFAVLWLLMISLNYSLSIGILHLHAHRKIFTSPALNRILEFLLCFPSVLSYPMMFHIHVKLHHRYENDAKDPTTTAGYEKGWRAVWYWVRYAYVCQRGTIKGLFGNDLTEQQRRLRNQYLIDTLGTIALIDMYFLFEPWRMLGLWLLPFIIVSINIGFFAWLTHGPARQDKINASINTTNNWQNILLHNQGYHLIHHLYPGVHWTQIPSKLDAMLEVDDDLIVPYWVLLPSAWRNAHPASLYNERYGRQWKIDYLQKKKANKTRISWFPYFGWI